MTKLPVMNTGNFILRKAESQDVGAILGMIQELAIFEKAEDQLRQQADDLLRDGFGPDPVFSSVVAENKSKEIIGMIIYYTAYSSWKGKILFLDDLYVKEKYRGLGAGKALMNYFLQQAKSMKVQEVRWQVLNWNEKAIRFYRQFSPRFDPDWQTCKISYEDLQNRLI
jgi:ribosomal protein S18 acetylase RimI-like enzyme